MRISNVQPLLPKNHTNIASIEVAPLQEAIRRVSLLTDRNAQIRMEFADGQVTLSAGADAGNATETLPCAFHGRDEFLIAFNPATSRMAWASSIPTAWSSALPSLRAQRL